MEGKNGGGLGTRLGSQVIVPEMYCLESVVCGHHICKRPLVGEKLLVDIKNDNANNPRAVAVGTCGIVGHIPKACSLASSIDEGL